MDDVTAAARAADPELSVERIAASGYERGTLALMSSPSLFGGGILIRVEGLEAASDSLVQDLTAYAADPVDEICVVLRYAGGTRGRGLLDTLRAAGARETLCHSLAKDDDKLGFAAGEFRRSGAQASPQALRSLVDALGSNLAELAAACRQLAEGLELSENTSDRVEVGQVEEWFGGRVEVTGFKVADATVAGRADQALSLLRHALATGSDPVPVVAALAAKVRALAKVSVAGRGRSAELAPSLGMAPWQFDRARRELSGWTEEGLAVAVLAVARADAEVKGAGRDPVFAVERAVLTVARARRP
jgi:DNA polymerase III subunit delta